MQESSRDTPAGERADTDLGAALPKRVAQPERYDALPGIGALPAWIWRRLPRAGRIAVAMLPVVVVALIVLLGPGIDESKLKYKLTSWFEDVVRCPRGFKMDGGAAYVIDRANQLTPRCIL